MRACIRSTDYCLGSYCSISLLPSTFDLKSIRRKVLFRLCTPYGSRVSLTGEEEEERRKKMTIFDFFKIRLLSFCTAELKSEDIFVLRRVRAFSGYWLNPQTTCLFTLAYCTVKTFQPPSSLHRDCYRNL